MKYKMDRLDVAHDALSDAEYILEQLEACEDKRAFRINFFACMALLRTIGQVLTNKGTIGEEDAETARKLRSVVLEVFSAHTEDPDKNRIFFDFIKKERDLLIHEYEINLDLDDWEVVYPEANGYATFNFGSLYRPLANQEFEGADARDLIDESVSWWRGQLKMIAERYKPD